MATELPIDALAEAIIWAVLQTAEELVTHSEKEIGPGLDPMGLMTQPYKIEEADFRALQAAIHAYLKLEYIVGVDDDSTKT